MKTNGNDIILNNIMEIRENAMGPLHLRVVIYLKMNSLSKGAIYCLFGPFSAYVPCFSVYYCLFYFNFHSNVHTSFAPPVPTPLHFFATPSPTKQKAVNSNVL